MIRLHKNVVNTIKKYILLNVANTLKNTNTFFDVVNTIKNAKTFLLFFYFYPTDTKTQGHVN